MLRDWGSRARPRCSRRCLTENHRWCRRHCTDQIHATRWPVQATASSSFTTEGRRDLHHFRNSLPTFALIVLCLGSLPGSRAGDRRGGHVWLRPPYRTGLAGRADRSPARKPSDSRDNVRSSSIAVDSRFGFGLWRSLRAEARVRARGPAHRRVRRAAPTTRLRRGRITRTRLPP